MSSCTDSLQLWIDAPAQCCAEQSGNPCYPRDRSLESHERCGMVHGTPGAHDAPQHLPQQPCMRTYIYTWLWMNRNHSTTARPRAKALRTHYANSQALCTWASEGSTVRTKRFTRQVLPALPSPCMSRSDQRLLPKSTVIISQKIFGKHDPVLHLHESDLSNWFEIGETSLCACSDVV